LWYEISNHKAKPVTSGKNIKSEFNRSHLKVVPNPVKNSTSIEFSFPFDAEAQFVLFNPVGQLILKEPVRLVSNQFQNKKLDVSQLTDGVYILGFQLKTGERVLDKMAVQNN
jgi:hypothetical protein